MSTVTGKKPLNFGWIGLGLILIGLLTVGIVFLVQRYREKRKTQPNSNDDYVIERKQKGSNEDQKQTFAQIFNYIVGLGFSPEFAQTLAGVSAHETGRWSSELATQHNNIFGMKSGGSGNNIQIGTAGSYAKYDSYESSIEDVCEWFKSNGYNDNDMQPENILQWMKSKKYFEDTLANYKRAVLSLINELKY